MADDREFERRFARRLREYAAAGAQEAGEPDMTSWHEVQGNRFRRLLSVAGVVGLGIAAALLVVAVVSGVRMVGQEPGPSASAVPSTTVNPTVSARPSEIASPTPPATSAPQPTPVASVAITGEVPPADAAPPNGVRYIPGLRLEALWAVLTTAGYACQSVAGAYPDAEPTGWSLECEKELGGALARVSAPYWTFAHVVAIHATVLPSPIEGSIIDPTVALSETLRLVTLNYADANPTAAADWLAQSIDSAACRDTPCQQTIGEARLNAQVGERGSRTVSLDGLRQVD